MYVGWRELLTQHDSPAGVTAYLRSARAAAWRSLCLSLPAFPPRFDGLIVPDSARACVLECRSMEVPLAFFFFFLRNDLSHPEAFETFVWLLHSCRLLTCKTGSVAWLRRSPAPSPFQRRRPIAVCVLYSPALSLSQPRRPIAVCWRSLNAHALCSVLSGVGRQPAPCLWLGLQQARWLGLQQARCGVIAVVYIQQEMQPLLASGWC